MAEPIIKYVYQLFAEKGLRKQRSFPAIFRPGDFAFITYCIYVLHKSWLVFYRRNRLWRYES
jgi:hypothetical protein